MKYWKIIFIIFMLALWQISLREIYFAARGPDVSFKLDRNHFLHGWPGYLVQYKADGSSEVVLKTHSIDKYAVTDEFIIAQSKEGWIVINRNTLQVFGFINNLNEIEKKLRLKLEGIDFVNEFSESNVYMPESLGLFKMVISLFFIVIITVVLLWGKLKGHVTRGN